MEMWKKAVKALIFPRVAVMLILLPVATAFLVYSMTALGTESVLSYISYVLAFYTLSIWCVRIPGLIKVIKEFKNGNRYAVRWREDVRLRMNISLYSSIIWNSAYAVFQLCLGIYNDSFWFYSLAGYYFCLACIRFYLSRHTTRHKVGEKLHEELIKYRACGFVLLFLNIALSVMVFFMIYFEKTSYHHEITTIALAAYTFTTLTVAIVNSVKYRKYESPVYSAAKAISLAAASVSMISLTSTMLTSFGNSDTDPMMRTAMLALLGGAVAVFIIVMSLYMIIRANKALKQEKENERK